MDTAKTRTAAAGITATILLILLIPAGLNYVPTLLAQTTETTEDTIETTEDTTETTEDTSSASQDYQEFQSCLSDAEVDGTVSEQQIRDCFAPIYNTGTGTASDDTTTPSTDSPSSDGDTDGADNDEESGGTE
jgi:predicted PurR-regulated permease PerM